MPFGEKKIKREECSYESTFSLILIKVARNTCYHLFMNWTWFSDLAINYFHILGMKVVRNWPWWFTLRELATHLKQALKHWNLPVLLAIQKWQNYSGNDLLKQNRIFCVNSTVEVLISLWQLESNIIYSSLKLQSIWHLCARWEVFWSCELMWVWTPWTQWTE